MPELYSKEKQEKEKKDCIWKLSVPCLTSLQLHSACDCLSYKKEEEEKRGGVCMIMVQGFVLKWMGG